MQCCMGNLHKKSEKYKNNLRKMYDSRTLMEKETEQSMILWLTIL